jgi:hypothetical protein
MARPGRAGHGMARPGEAGLGEARQGKAKQLQGIGDGRSPSLFRPTAPLIFKSPLNCEL